MGTQSAAPDFTAAAHMVVRLLVALYSIASATGVIVGTNLSLLLAPLMSAIMAKSIVVLIVTLLCALMLAGVKRRAMALLLAIMFVWSSYFAILGPNAQVVSGSHWRDMMLIAALLLIYADAAHDEHNDISTLARFLREPRTLANTFGPLREAEPAPQELKLRRTSQTVFHTDLEHLGER